MPTNNYSKYYKHRKSLNNLIEKYIRVNCGNPNFNVHNIAQLLHLNISTVREYVHTQYGFSPKHLIDTIRLEKSVDLLISIKYIIDISNSVGYTNSQTFRRAFKKRLKVTPRELRDDILAHRRNMSNFVKLYKKKLWNA